MNVSVDAAHLIMGIQNHVLISKNNIQYLTQQIGRVNAKAKMTRTMKTKKQKIFWKEEMKKQHIPARQIVIVTTAHLQEHRLAAVKLFF